MDLRARPRQIAPIGDTVIAFGNSWNPACQDGKAHGVDRPEIIAY